mmetsp:Transcript_3841/g.10147  ORF Transcript_3841/g.10147 Transcript_3841/m.10147 type:complete len:131 (+) Transcript_3841:1248-1640(+)
MPRASRDPDAWIAKVIPTTIASNGTKKWPRVCKLDSALGSFNDSSIKAALPADRFRDGGKGESSSLCSKPSGNKCFQCESDAHRGFETEKYCSWLDAECARRPPSLGNKSGQSNEVQTRDKMTLKMREFP